MEKTLSSKGVLLDISSMRGFASQLLGKGKRYEALLRLIIEKDYYNDNDLPLPSLKELQERLGLKYALVRKHLFEIYDDLLDHQENSIDFSIKSVEYVFGMWYFDNYVSLVINQLPVMPRVGEQMWIPYFKEKVGTNLFFVDSVHHYFNDTKQSISISLSPGSYNSFWAIRKDEAYLKGEISSNEYFTSKDDNAKKKLGYKRW